MANPAEQDNPPVGRIIAPGPTPAESINVAEKARKKAEVTPTDRIEARADRHITDLKTSHATLYAELQIVRYTELPHLRDDVRWLEERESSLMNALTLLKASYEWAISFNWFSFALIAIGGCVVSYAAFFPAQNSPGGFDIQKMVATFAFASLLIGVIVQGYLSHRGRKTLMGMAEIAAPSKRPSPSPKLPEHPPA